MNSIMEIATGIGCVKLYIVIRNAAGYNFDIFNPDQRSTGI